MEMRWKIQAGAGERRDDNLHGFIITYLSPEGWTIKTYPQVKTRLLYPYILVLAIRSIFRERERKRLALR